MVVRRNDGRRRRTVIGGSGSLRAEKSPAASAGTATVRSRKPATRRKSRRPYQAGALRRHQPKSTDWIPKRRGAVAIFLATLAGLLAILLAAGWFVHHSTGLSDGMSKRFSLQSTASLSVWFSTVLLLASALASLQIRALREHRSNDYRGTCRVWYWFAAILLLGSINCVLNLGELATAWLGAVGQGHGTTIGIIIQLVALTLIVARGAVEVRHSPASLAAIIVVWIAYGGSMILRLPGPASLLVRDDGYSACGLELLAATTVFAGVTLYARFVYLQANGLAKGRSKRSRKTGSTGSSDAARRVGRSARVEPAGTSSIDSNQTGDRSEEPSRAAADPASREARRQQTSLAPQSPAVPAAPPPARSSGPLSAQVRTDSRDADVDDEDARAGQSHRLSKAERKKLKKQQRNDGFRRAA